MTNSQASTVRRPSASPLMRQVKLAVVQPLARKLPLKISTGIISSTPAAVMMIMVKRRLTMLRAQENRATPRAMSCGRSSCITPRSRL
ncbi:hypothetical protein D9M71_750850 [compost metagenome]